MGFETYMLLQGEVWRVCLLEKVGVYLGLEDVQRLMESSEMQLVITWSQKDS